MQTNSRAYTKAAFKIGQNDFKIAFKITTTRITAHEMTFKIGQTNRT